MSDKKYAIRLTAEQVSDCAASYSKDLTLLLSLEEIAAIGLALETQDEVLSVRLLAFAAQKEREELPNAERGFIDTLGRIFGQGDR
ncbi:hypothetical protein [Sutterella wadsworthensis]|uniref:hypothetical protein n=1 Tax=Sutterella wadsworthensis TaxID=40545 RepID=UPI003AF1CD4B